MINEKETWIGQGRLAGVGIEHEPVRVVVDWAAEVVPCVEDAVVVKEACEVAWVVDAAELVDGAVGSVLVDRTAVVNDVVEPDAVVGAVEGPLEVVGELVVVGVPADVLVVLDTAVVDHTVGNDDCDGEFEELVLTDDDWVVVNTEVVDWAAVELAVVTVVVVDPKVAVGTDGDVAVLP